MGSVGAMLVRPRSKAAKSSGFYLGGVGTGLGERGVVLDFQSATHGWSLDAVELLALDDWPLLSVEFRICLE